MELFLFIALLVASWISGFFWPFMELRRVEKQLYGEPTKDTLWTTKNYLAERKAVIVLRELGMESFDTIVVRTPRWDEVTVTIPRPKPIPSKP
jgi:hypothetical protein